MENSNPVIVKFSAEWTGQSGSSLGAWTHLSFDYVASNVTGFDASIKGKVLTVTVLSKCRTGPP
jgi:hypothetical protein